MMMMTIVFAAFAEGFENDGRKRRKQHTTLAGREKRGEKNGLGRGRVFHFRNDIKLGSINYTTI